MPTKWDERQHQKHLINRYREAAHDLIDVPLQPHAHVQVLEDGAFVEVTVWVPKALIEDRPSSEAADTYDLPRKLS